MAFAEYEIFILGYSNIFKLSCYPLFLEYFVCWLLQLLFSYDSHFIWCYDSVNPQVEIFINFFVTKYYEN
jgi:hypothetical protein